MRAGLVIALWLAAHAGFAATACVQERAAPPTPAGAPSALAVDAGATPLAAGRAPIVTWPPVVMRCLQMGDSCGGSAATCRALTSLSEEARAQARHCFDATTCAAYTECFRAFLAAHPMTPASPPVANDE